MGRPPAYIFIVRHGNRLDAADKLWHLSSPTPYDPPLTYGGWLQCRTIGRRIADILRESAIFDTPSTAANCEQPAPKKRRFKIVIHSSPFLRCVQTSIAISSGIASESQPFETSRNSGLLPPLVGRPSGQNEPTLTKAHDLGGKSVPRNVATSLHKSVLRIDAFLGEWLSPGYFELITPPPSSVLMVAGAKAELLRRGDYSSFNHTATSHSRHAHSHSTGHLWGASRSNTWSSHPTETDELAKSGSQYTPPVGLFYNNSGTDDWTTPRWESPNSTSTQQTTKPNHYIPPVPHSAISSRSPAPTNYVAHARDACVDVDYQWDSMRPPYDWGDGGEFGEEWTSMHRRFRKGIQKLVDWYSVHDAPTEMVTRTVRFKARYPRAYSNENVTDEGECAIDDDDDDDAESDTDEDCVRESVVVLVSHGAGCNALIGAITQQPVLVDVGLASLSVAARRPGKETLECQPDGEDSHASKWTGAVHSGHPGGIVPLSKYYEMKLFADSDHLRSVPTTPVTPRNSMAAVFGTTRSRHSNSLSGTPGSTSLYTTGTVGQRSSSAGSFNGTSDLTARRPSGAFTRTALTTGGVPTERITSLSSTDGQASNGFTVGSGISSFLPPILSTTCSGHSRSASIGLWSPISLKGSEKDTFAANEDDRDAGNDSDMEILLSFGPKNAKLPLQESKKGVSSISGKGVPGHLDPSSLSVAHSVYSSRDDKADNEDNTLSRGFAAMASTLPRLDTNASMTGEIGLPTPGHAPAPAS
ncbi:hypothetical protein SEPCBS57363_001414 [Sporothrix epigloea]|uniref:Phosphoglycerate mutase family protein n=1 Tax=Sporothrix epigloea TaxID=1892477 RepID=A0ABP0DDC5_9PEZI